MSAVWRNRITAKCNSLAKVIREKGEISFSDLCIEAHIAPSTLYSYVPMIRRLFSDIQYEDKVFKVAQHKENPSRGD